MPTESGQAPLASSSPPSPEIDLLLPRPPSKLQSTKKIKEKEEKPPRKRGRPRKNPPVPEIKEEQEEFLALSSEQQDTKLNPMIKEENSGDPTDGTRKARSAAQTAVKRIADVEKLSRLSFQYQTRKVASRAKKTDQVKKSRSKKAAPRNRKLFQCEICPYKTLNNFQFEHHLNGHESPEFVDHICPHCTNPPRQFSQKQSFDYHMNSHSGLNKMMCDICVTLIDPNAILEHVRGHSNVEKIFQCSCCSYHCGTREGYLTHTRNHGSDALICDVCSKKFRRRQIMLEHMHKEHNLLEIIKCDVENCGKEFLETWMFLDHKRRHSVTFPCPDCKLQFPTTRLLLGHQVREHSKEKPHPCSECSERFLDRIALKDHAIRAHGAAKLKCSHCPKEFATHCGLSLHMNLHDARSFRCDQCDKAFGDRRHLKRHQGIHRTTKDFVCEECGKAFRRAEQLRLHRQIHIGDKKHKCSYCSKGFVNRKHLISHERIHTGEKPYICEACGKDFNQQSTLHQHMKIHQKELIAIKNKSEMTETGSTSSSKPELNVG